MYYLKAQKTVNLGIVLHLYREAEKQGESDERIDTYAEEDKEKALDDLLKYANAE